MRNTILYQKENTLLLRVRNNKNQVGKTITRESVEIPYIRIQKIDRQRQNSQGSQVFGSWKIFLDTDVEISKTDLLKYEGEEFSILEIYRVKDINDFYSHIEVKI